MRLSRAVNIMAFFKKKKTEPEPLTITGKPEFIIAGLGNPGKEYELSRHNAGFLCIDMLCNKYNFRCDKINFNSVTGKTAISGHICLVMRPQTYMNNSGEAVGAAAAFYKIPPENIIVVFDDISLPSGVLRIRKRGSAGGHNGVKSIIYHLSSEEFTHIKIGVGDRSDPDSDLKDYVLGAFSKTDIEALKTTMERAVDALPFIINGDTELAMSKFNG